MLKPPRRQAMVLGPFQVIFGSPFWPAAKFWCASLARAGAAEWGGRQGQLAVFGARAPAWPQVEELGG